MKDRDGAVALNADLAKGLHNVLEAIVLLNSALNLFKSRVGFKQGYATESFPAPRIS